MTPQRAFTPEQIAFVRKRVSEQKRYIDIMAEFNEVFGESLCYLQLDKMMKRNGIEKKPTHQVLTDEQSVFVEGLVKSQVPQREIARRFNERFGTSIGQTQLRRLMQRSNIQSVRAENVAKPVGYERWDEYRQCMLIKVKEISVAGMKQGPERDRFRMGQWKLKQNHVSEEHHGEPLPKNKVVVFLDGDRTNYSPDNLYAVPLEVVGNVEKWNLHSEDPEIYKSALMYGELYFQMMKDAPEAMERMKRTGALSSKRALEGKRLEFEERNE